MTLLSKKISGMDLERFVFTFSIYLRVDDAVADAVIDKSVRDFATTSSLLLGNGLHEK